MTVSTLPKLAYATGVDDHGPSDGEGSTTCPHCGAAGRYVHNAVTEDGHRVAAMSGCIKLFPRSETFTITEALQERVRKYRAEGWKLTSWDQKMLDALDAFRAGDIDHEQLHRTLKHQHNHRKAHYARKYRGR